MKLSMSMFSSQMLVLLAVVAPTALMAGSASAATLQPEVATASQLQASISDVEFAANTAAKVHALLSSEQLNARFTQRYFSRIKTRSTTQPTSDFATPSAIDVFQSVANQDA